METISQLARWTFSFDRGQTSRIYRDVEPISCECIDCKNFRAAGELAFSPEFLTLLRQIGIDPSKPAELCHYGSSFEPMPTQGWFHFVGHLLSGADAWRQTGPSTSHLEPESFPGIKSIGLSTKLSQVPGPFSDHAVVQLEFETVTPWVLGDEPNAA